MASEMKKTYSRLVLATCVAMATWYAVGYSAWVNIPSVNPGDVLTSSWWNNLVGNVNSVNGKIGTLTAGKSCTSDGSKIDCVNAKQAIVQVDTTGYSAWSAAWVLGPSFPTTSSFKAGSLVKLTYIIPTRNDSTGWGGAYIEPQISFNNGSTWNSLGSSGYDGGVMINGVSAIGSYTNTILINPSQASDYTVKVRFYFRSYDWTVYINNQNNINAVSATATVMPGVNGTQHYAKVIIEEI